MKEYIDGDYIVREYPSGTIVKTLLQAETAGEVIELPKNPLIDLQERVNLMQQALDYMLLGGAL